ncbi:MAG: ATP-binding protein, partial [bacterium]|nr:ATP-binding protein [bacterium]
NHELRSPLNAVIAFSDVLLLESSDQAIRDYAMKIKTSGQYLAQLIEDLLDFDRIEAGKVRLEYRNTDINQLVASTLDMRRDQLPKSFTIENHLDPGCREIPCDPIRIKQVLTNLIDNAIKYSPNGGTIRIETRPSGPDIHVLVRDEGIGIPVNEIESIFERFRQLEGGYTRRAGGLGIGLSLAHNLITLHKGKIWAESVVGKGSTFTFTLPQSQETPCAPPEPEKKTSSPDAPWKDMSILIVDDIQQYHELMRIFLRSAKEIFSAFDGREALEICVREKPDLILLDLRMPIMDGFETLKHLKDNASLRDLPVISISAQVLKEDRDRSLRMGATAFITKPFDLSTLQEAVRKIFR